MSDLIERLRDADTTRRIGESYADTHERRQRDRDEAAAEIERLRAALRALHDEMDEYQRINNLSAYNNQVMRQARAALGE